jgi:hypothetical protein
LKGRDHLGDLGIERRIILKVTGVRCGLDSTGAVVGSCEHSNEPSGSKNIREFTC